MKGNYKHLQKYFCVSITYVQRQMGKNKNWMFLKDSATQQGLSPIKNVFLNVSKGSILAL